MGSRESAGMQGAASGAATGTAIAPGWGTVIGAGVGGLMGYMGAADQESKEKKAHKEQERLRREHNRYAAFFKKQPMMEQARQEKSLIPGINSGWTQGAQMGGMIGNLYKEPARYDTRTGEEILRFDPQTGEQITQNHYE